MSIDIVILDVPCTLIKMPRAAAALLKANLTSAGFSSRTIDFNIKFFNELEKHPNFKYYEQYLLGSSEIDHNKKEELINIISKWVDSVLELDPLWVGISVFTYQCRIATTHFCEIIKQKNPNIKIVIGGQGLGQGGINGEVSFAQFLKKQKLIDHYIKSEGERSLVNLLNGKNDIGIDSDTFKQLENLNDILPPDYSDYNFDEYDDPSLFVTGSRGCVRDCSFCDIHEHWKFKSRDGDIIAKEIIELKEKYKINSFYFTDSLVNGNFREFKKFIKYMANYNDNTQEKIKWTGQYIIRSKGSEDDEYYKILGKSGAHSLQVGIEAGSDKVRYHMNKKFTNDDFYYTLDQFKKNKITCVVLMIVGYVTETEEDFNQTLDLIKKCGEEYHETINYISFSETLSILPGTPLYNDAKKIGLVIDEKYENNWINYNNPTLTIQERIKRVVESRKLADKYNLANQGPGHNLLDYLNDNVELFEKRIKIKQKANKIFELKQITK